VREEEATLFRLQRFLVAEEPDILAVDSIQELATDQHELVAFMESLPAATQLVQVTGGERLETLGKVAARYNLKFNRLDPYDEARTAARIASLGGGHQVIAFENSCEVVVSRHRSIGKGGWSQNRYIRRIHGAVQQKAREIEAELVAAGIRFDKKETLAFGGASRIAFQVYAPRDMVPVRAYRGTDVQVKIKGKKLDRLVFRPMTGRPRYLIVGIDPGTTTAIAALDLDGRLVHLFSSRQASMSDIIEQLYRTGKPLVIATDVSPMPFSVEKIRRAFSAVGYTPRQDRSVEDQLEFVAGYTYGNIHERDALAAAVDAYRQYKNKFQNIAKRVPAGYDLDEVRASVIRGQSIERALADLGVAATTPAAPAPAAAEEKPDEKRDERILILDGMVKRLRALVAELQEEMREKDQEIVRLRRRMQRRRAATDEKIRKDAEISRRDAIIHGLKGQLKREEKHSRSLRKRLERRKEIAAIEQSGEDLVPVKVLASLTRDDLRRLVEDLGVNDGDVLYVQRPDGWGRSVVKDLAEMGVRALVIGTAPGGIDPQLTATFEELQVPLLPDAKVGVAIRGRSGTADRRRLDDALLAWDARLRQREREKKTAMLDYIFKEYRSEREKEVRRSG
ncbi:MAG: DUF460 domain-containing protein, partial [Actinobacteria bacterium]